jgi:hypothetical protein
VSITGSGSSGELGEVVRGADDGPFGAHFFDAPQQELPESSCLFELFEHRLHNLLSHIRVPEDVLRQPLFARWEGYGIPAAEILAKVERNDLPNSMLVIAKSRKADFVLRT